MLSRAQLIRMDDHWLAEIRRNRRMVEQEQETARWDHAQAHPDLYCDCVADPMPRGSCERCNDASDTLDVFSRIGVVSRFLADLNADPFIEEK